MEDQRFSPTEDAHTSRFSALNVHSFGDKVRSSKPDNGEPASYVPLKLQGGEDFDQSEQDYSNSDSLPSLVTSTISSTSIHESMDIFEHAVMSSLQRSITDVALNDAGEGNNERRVRFAPGCHDVPDTSRGQRTRACCDEFMEQTISVYEIERIFDIDFEKDWVRLVMSYRPRMASAANENLLSPEELDLRKKVQKGEKRMRKREEKIRRYTKKAQTAEEEQLLLREILQKMSDKAKKFMEKRKAQWERQRQKAAQDKAKQTAKRVKAAEKASEKVLKAGQKKRTREVLESRAAGDAARNSSDTL